MTTPRMVLRQECEQYKIRNNIYNGARTRTIKNNINNRTRIKINMKNNTKNRTGHDQDRDTVQNKDQMRHLEIIQTFVKSQNKLTNMKKFKLALTL